ncbi:hypothetical protein CXG81DRAFT_4871, partial [Caulochytrium protostelioides]
MSLLDILRARLLEDMIQTVRPPGKWKILVVDPTTMRILTSVLKMPDITANDVTLVEDITRQRQPYPQKEAIYFLSPTHESVTALVDDFLGGRPAYGRAHIFFTSSLPDRLFDKIKRCPASLIGTFKELNVDFMALESRVFTFEQPNALAKLFNPQATSVLNHELEGISKRLVNLLATIGEYPYIRFVDPAGSGGTRASLNSKFANMVQDELEALKKLDPDFPPKSPYPPAILLVCDRTVDAAAPLLHEFTYQAMVHDLLPAHFKGGKFMDREETAHVLDETDDVWLKNRHRHIAEVIDDVSEGVRHFSSNNAAAAFERNARSGQTTDKIEAMKEAMHSIPEYTEKKKRYALHTDICTQCMDESTARGLLDLAKLEQDLILNQTSDGNPCSLTLKDVLRIVEDPRYDHVDVIRFIMIYIISREGIPDADREALLEAARLTLVETQAVTNFSMLGVRLSMSYEKRRRKAPVPVNTPFDTSRYDPAIKGILADLADTGSDRQHMPWLTEPRNLSELGRRPGSHYGSDAGGSPSNGPRLILFVLGGITRSEMRACYETAARLGRDILIGSTHVYHPEEYLEHVKCL